ncbi:chemotaxis protein CheW [Pseudanabaena sp. FACHB-2040]|uniref:chemotaxis protein CheW n=1 Tax=Pseudanabaena sp. FACHB-2040 TaxID=2692859 RepID=UPI0016834C3E|nr:chemotaxis protein CheW [Pseudanabaena sp. FACHB-2040]MBD2257758.1 chemotaxis protein CheW [Pseudanabaena sp. FACHB-2040]
MILEEVATVLSEASLEELEASSSEEQFLQIYLDGDLSFLLPVKTLVEIIKISIDQVVPMFQMAPWVMGVYNCRGEVLWMMDLNHFLGLPPWYEQDNSMTKHTAVVIKAPRSAEKWAKDNRPTLGLIVNRVEGMVSSPSEAIQPLPTGFAEPGLMPFLSGVWQAGTGANHLILDSTAILRAAAHLEP